ncbi:MAG: hypothetical protein NTZ78_03845 [Candidatus Aureabacteria bacterium]|nr:hypothetical protein [Candidatus Auribacterota bacterium]
MIAPEAFNHLLDVMCQWAEAQQHHILSTGLALDTVQSADAKRIGVTHPERVRLLEVSEMPSPEDPIFIEIVERARLIAPDIEAITVGYGIYIHSGYWGVRSLVAHELVHVAQVEKLGGIRQFYEHYMGECVQYGYPNGPMEQEAMKMEAAFIEDTE